MGVPPGINYFYKIMQSFLLTEPKVFFKNLKLSSLNDQTVCVIRRISSFEVANRVLEKNFLEV